MPKPFNELREKGFIIEHPTRGVLMDIGYDPVDDAWKPRWSWAKPRTGARWFASLTSVNEALRKLPERQREGVTVLRWGTYEEVRIKRAPN